MKKALTIILAVITTMLLTTTAFAYEKDFHDETSDAENTLAIFDLYGQALDLGNYYTTDKSCYTVSIEGVECYQKMDGSFIYNGETLADDVETIAGKNILKTFIGEYYIASVKAGNCIKHFGKASYVVIMPTYDLCYVTNDGKLMCNDSVIYDCVATMDKGLGKVIYQTGTTAIVMDSDFIYVYQMGEISTIRNILTGEEPKG